MNTGKLQTRGHHNGVERVERDMLKMLSGRNGLRNGAEAAKEAKEGVMKVRNLDLKA